MVLSSPLRKGLRYFRNLVIVVVLLCCLVTALLLLFEKKWGEFAVQQSIEMLNEELNVPITTSGIEFTFFANFPHASLHLRDVVIPSAHENVFGKRDTLLVAKSVFLALNPFDLLNNRVRVKSFRIVQGYLSLKHDKTGLQNYDLLKKKENNEADGKTSFALEVQSLSLSQMVVQFDDAHALFTGKLVVPTLNAKFRFTEGNSSFDVESDGLVEYVRQGDFIFAQKQHFELKSRFKIEAGCLETERTSIELDRNRFAISGYWHLKKNDTRLNVSGSHLDLRTLLAFASQYKWQLPPNIDLKGALNADLSMEGDASYGGKLRLNMKIYGEKLALQIANQNYTLKVFQGSFSNGRDASRRSTMFEIAKCEIQRKNSTLSAQFRINNLEHPSVYTKLDFTLLDNEVLLPFLTPYIQDYKSIRGNGELVASLQNLDSFSFEMLRNPRLRLDVDFDVNTFKANPHQTFTDLRGAATLADEDLVKGALRGKWNGTDFELGLNVQHFLSLFRKGLAPQWTVNARLAHCDIPISGIPVWNPDSEEQATNDTLVQRRDPWELVGTIKGDLELYKSLYRGTLIDSVQARFFVTQNRMQFDLQKAKLLGGRVRGELLFQESAVSPPLLRAELYTERLNLQELFLRYDDFGLKNFGHENISGFLSGTISLHLPFEGGKPSLPDLQMHTKVVVHNGELREIKGLEKLSTFIKLDELRHIRFSTLENEISVMGQKIVVPQMNVQSSALSLKLQGEQHFDSRFQYRLQLSLSDLLFNRWRGKSRDLDNEVYEEGGNMGGSLYLLIEGDSTDVRVSFDRRALAERYQQRVQREKEELKALFNEEFNWENRDSAQNAEQTPTVPTKRYTIEWEENDTIKKADSVKAKPKQQPTKKKKDAPAVTWEDE